MDIRSRSPWGLALASSENEVPKFVSALQQVNHAHKAKSQPPWTRNQFAHFCFR